MEQFCHIISKMYPIIGKKEIYPQTSLMRDRTALVLLVRIPFLREGRGGSSRRRTIWPLFMPTAMPNTPLAHILVKKIIFAEIEIHHFHRCIHHLQRCEPTGN